MFPQCNILTTLNNLFTNVRDKKYRVEYFRVVATMTCMCVQGGDKLSERCVGVREERNTKTDKSGRW